MWEIETVSRGNPRGMDLFWMTGSNRCGSGSDNRLTDTQMTCSERRTRGRQGREALPSRVTLELGRVGLGA